METEQKPTLRKCARCGHDERHHSIAADGTPRRIIDNLWHGPDFYCSVAYQPDRYHAPWSSCGCEGWAAA